MIPPPALLKLLRAVEARGRIETARRLRQRLSEIFRYAIAEGLAANDPAAALSAAMLDPRPPRPQPALTHLESCRELLAACDRAPARRSTVLASRLLALTAVRLGALRGMLWGEVEDLLGEAPQWRVPAARMKLKLAKKSEDRFDHIVPLSRQAVAVLRSAARENGYDTHSGGYPVDALVFPGRDRGRPIGEGAIGDLYDRVLRHAQDERLIGRRHVPHGWRSSFSTIMNEQLGELWRSTIDRALAHTPKDKVEAAYNRAELLARRRELFDRWGELLGG
jgi:integrase